MSLVVQIGADVKGAVKGIEDVSLRLKDQRQILINLQKQYASLSTQQARGAIGKELAADIKIAQAEITRLGAGATSSFGKVGKAATGALSSLRNFAYILPGIGVAGLLGGLVAGIGSLFSKTSDEADKLKDKVKDLIKSVGEISAVAAGGTGGDVALVRALSNAVLDQTLSYEKRNRALAELKEINKAYFGDLTLEKAELGALKTAVDEYTNAIISQAVVKAFSDEIGKLSVEISKQLTSYNEIGKTLDDLNKKRENAKRYIVTENNLGVAVKSESGEYKRLTSEIDAAQKKLRATSGATSKLTDQMFSLKTAIQQAVNESLNFKDLTPPPASSTKPDPFIDPYQFFSVRKLKAETDLSIDIKNLQFILMGGVNKTFKEQVTDRINKSIEGLVVNPNLKAATPVISEALKLGEATAEAFNKGFKDLATQGLYSIGESLGEALGGGDIRNAFEAFGRTLGGAIQAIGKQIIAIGTAAILAKKALTVLFKNPFIAVAAGIALVAAGSALKSVLGRGLPGRASGGPVAGGQPYMVGERGQEVFVPSTSGRIIPNNNLGNLGGSAVPIINFNGDWSLQGNMIKLLLNRTDRYQGRNV